MAPIFSKQKSEGIGNGVLLICLGVLFFTNAWWPGILLAFWLSLATRQILSGRLYDFALSSFILLGLFFTLLFKLDFAFLLPILFVVGGIFIIFREFCFPEDTNGEEKSEEIRDDIDDGKNS